MILKNVKAVITGAGSGLGEGTARYLKEKGAELLLIDLNADGLKNVADEIGSQYYVGDVSNEEEMKNALTDFNGPLKSVKAFFISSSLDTSPT